MKKQILLITAMSMALSLIAQDWAGIPIPVNPPSGSWVEQAVSDGFNYYSVGWEARPAEFTNRWNENYINGFSGPSATAYHKDHAWTNDGSLNLHGAWDASLPIIYTGCISSKETFTYPLYIEARVKLSGCMLANNVWMLSADETEEIDIMEAYATDREGLEWFDQQIHLSHHVFIRNPFTDYQPRDEEEVYGTWYWEEGRDTWRGEWFRIGVYWKDPWHLEYYIDGEWVRTIKKNEHSYKDHTGETVTHTTSFDAIDKYGYTNGTGLSKPMHIILNMEQQSWLSEQDIYPTRDDLDDANGKNVYAIDWVRVYKGGGDQDPNNPPVANAGSDQTKAAGTTTATLSGSGSDPDGDAITYSWTQVSGTDVAINNYNSATASVSGLSNGNNYVFRLTVSDGSLIDSDDVTITVNTSTNQAPVANAGNDQTLLAGTTTASLIGSGSDPDGDAITYSWTQVSGSNVSISNSNSANASVSGLSNGNTYVFRLTVSDGALSGTDEIQITVNNTTGQLAYPDGIAHAIPGTIYSVNFDKGGEGIAYHDATSGNSGNGPRQDEGVDTEYRITEGNVGWIAQGEWLEYTVNVASAGTYDIDVQVASVYNTGQFHIEFNELDKTGVQSVSATGGWGTFVNKTISGVSLTAGQQVMRVYMDGPSFNLGTIKFTAQDSDDDNDDTSCDLPFASTGTSITQQTKTWTTGVIDISCVTAADISMLAKGEGPMETSDYLNIYYQVDGGSKVAMLQKTNAFGETTVSASNISGNTVEIIVEGKTSWSDETYTVSNISITDAGGSSDDDDDDEPGDVITIEAESFVATSGTINDAAWGGPGLGANKTASGINWVNNGDYMDYNVTIPENGAYEIVYYISSPNTGSTISFGTPGTVFNTTTVPNNGAWDSYQPLTASNTANFTAGDHVVRLTAGAQTWTWNMDKFTLQRVSGMKRATEVFEPISEMKVYPNPVNEQLYISTTTDLINSNFTIYNSVGIAVITEQIISTRQQVSLSNLSSGLYIVQVVNGSTVINKRIVKE